MAVSGDPSVITQVPDAVQGRRHRSTGLTVWLTGLSGAGKSTLAREFAQQLRASGRPVEILDGDELRLHLSPDLGFTPDDRNAHVRRVTFLARLLARNGVVVLVPVIAPFATIRNLARTEHTNDGTPYVEVHVATPVTECIRRDTKGLYARQRAGTLTNLTGVDDVYEAPTNADLCLDTTASEVAHDVGTLTAYLSKRGLL